MVKSRYYLQCNRSDSDFAGYLNDGRSYVAHADLNRLEWSARSDVPARVSTQPGQTWGL